MVASVHHQATIELLYQIYKDDYNGVLYFDTFPDATGLDPVSECETNINTVEKILKIVEHLLANNELSLSMQNQDAVRSQQIFNNALFDFKLNKDE